MKRHHAVESAGKHGTAGTGAFRPLVGGLAALLLTVVAPAQALVLGITEGVTYRSTDNQIEERFQPIAEVLSKTLKQPVTVQVLSSYNKLREALAQQQVDMVFIHPAHIAFEATKSGHYRTVAWTAGFTEYKVSFLCKDPQPIANWKSVAGKSLVAPDPDSITTAMVRAMLRENGLGGSAVEMKTTRYQDAVPFYVENGFAAYGATAAKGVVKNWKDAGGKTCAESRPVPIKQWLVASRLDPATANLARDTLLTLSQTDIGKKALTAASYNGFVPPSVETEKMLTAWLGL